MLQSVAAAGENINDLAPAEFLAGTAEEREHLAPLTTELQRYLQGKPGLP